MSTQQQRQEWRELAGRLSYFGDEGRAQDAITALLADVDALTQERDAYARNLAERTTVTEQISMALHVRDTQLTAAIAERDALAAELARVRAQLAQTVDVRKMSVRQLQVIRDAATNRLFEVYCDSLEQA